MSRTITSGSVVFLDTSDNRKLDVYITSNLPTVQLYNTNDKTYTPDWSVTNLQLNADVYLDSKEITPETINWYTKIGTTETLIGSTSSLAISTNVLSNNPIVTYICRVKYQSIETFNQITFTRVDTGHNGMDGTSVNILGSYNTLEELQTAHPTGNAGDAYIINGNLYVWEVDDAEWGNVGNIQGPAGKDAKSIVLSGSSQVFKVNKTNVITPTTITITAQALNTNITNWTYSTNGGQTFLSTVPTGVSRNGNIVTITGSTITSNSITIKASDGEVEDVFTIYKAIDGSDGSKGNDGAPAPIAFLTNENVTFSANAQGQIATTTITSNIVAYNGTTKVTPTIGTITGTPTGMTITSSTIAASNEIMLTITIANNSTLGSALNNMGVISIPVTYPVSTVLSLTWSKVNTGAPGSSASLVDITPSALYFKSTMGKDGIFTPDYIYLYPRFQNATYNGWQYSTDGGINWIAVDNTNGLSVGTYNSVPNTLRVQNTSVLYTDTVTSISFRCNSLTSGIYDTVSIAKIYDVVDLKIGGRNLLLNSGTPLVLSTNNATNFPVKTELITEGTRVFRRITRTNIESYPNTMSLVNAITWDMLTDEIRGKTVTMSFAARASQEINFSLFASGYAPVVQFSGNPGPVTIGTEWQRFSMTTTIPTDISTGIRFGPYLTNSIEDVSTFYLDVCEWQIEFGNIATDYSPAHEDLLNSAANVNVMLSNESHFFEADSNGVPTATSIVLDVIGYKGSIQSSTKVGTISGLPSAGMTANITNNETTNTKITITITTALTSAIADYGTLTIPITVNEHTINKKFSWVKAKAGATGAGASLVTINPSALYFKSTMGKDGVFTPDDIFLYPQFQNVSYRNWQYSIDGGINWIATAGVNGLSVVTRNGIGNILKINKNSNIYTNDITSISFRCNSSDANIYDVVTVTKIYDVVDLQFGGRNYILDSGSEWSTNGRVAQNGSAYNVYKTGLNSVFEQLLGKKLTMSFEGMVETTDGENGQIMCYGTNGTPKYRLTSINFTNIAPNQWQKFSAQVEVIPIDNNTNEARIEFYGTSPTVSQIHIRKFKLEVGNVVTDWSPAPEDLIEESSNTTVMLSNEAHLFEADLDGTALPSTIVLDVIGFKGATRSATQVGTITGIPSTGMAVSTSNNNTTNTKITISTTRNLTSTIADYGTLTIPITVNGHTINKVFSWAKSNDMSNLSIGGRNLLRWTKNLPITTRNSPDGISTYSTSGNILEQTENGIKLKFNGTQSVALSVPLAYDGCVKNNEVITLSFDYRGNITDIGTFYFLQRTSPNVSLSLNPLVTLVANETEWQHCEVTFSLPNANDRINYQMLLFYALDKYTSENWIEIKNESLKLEKGHKATSWTPAIEEMGGTTFQLYAPKGYLLTNETPEITLQTFAYEGSRAINNATFKWYSWSGEDWIVINGTTGTSLTVNKTDVLKSTVYKCEMIYGGKVYEATATVEDKTDIYESLIRVIAKQSSDNRMYWVLYATVYSEDGEHDALLGPVSETSPDSPITGDYWYKIDTTNYTVILMKYSGTAWVTTTDAQELLYDWALFKDTTEMEALGAQSKVIMVTASDFSRVCSVQCNIFDADYTLLSRNSQILNDPSDPIISATEPTNPIDKQLWIKIVDNGTYVISIWDEATKEWLVSEADSQKKVHVEKPTKYAAGDIWIVGGDYQPIAYVSGVAQTSKHLVGTMLKAQFVSATYSDSDWVEALNYKERLDELEDQLNVYNQYFSFDNTGLTMSAKSLSGQVSEFKTKLTNTELGFYQGEDKVAYINNNQLNISKAEISNGLAVVGASPMLSVGGFSFVVESNGSLSIITNN